MEIVIYLDSLFLLNVSINYWILKAIVYQFGFKQKIVRILLTATVGASFYILLLLVPMHTRIIQLLEICVSVPLMVLILLPKKSRNLFMQALGYGFLYSFLVAGILRAVFSKWQLFSHHKTHIIAVLTGAFIVFEGIMKYLQTQRAVKRHGVCNVRLVSERDSICIKAIVDTGNTLIEPISKKPVCLVEQDVLEGLIPKDNMFVRAIPYRSVGCEQGLLYGVQIPELHITYGTEQFFLRKVICAGVEHKLFTKGKYQMILHPACIAEEFKALERGEEDVVGKRGKKKNIFVGRTGLE